MQNSAATSAWRYTLAPHNGGRESEEDAGGIRIDGSACRRSAPACGSAPGDKGLKTGALGFVSNVVIGVASTAPGYSLAASLGLHRGRRRHRAAGAGDPAGRVRPDAAHRGRLLLHEPRRSGLRHDLLVGHAGRWARTPGWLGGWAIIVADIIVMANLAQIAGLYCSCSSAGRRPPTRRLAVTARRHRLDRDHDADLRHRHRALRAHAGRPARAPSSSRWPSSPSSRWSRSRAGDAGRASIDPSLSWINPFARRQLRRARRRASCSRSSSTGAGTARSRSTRRPRTPARPPGKAAVVSTVILLGDLRDRRVAAQAFGGPEAPRSTTPTTCSARSAPTSSARRWTSC